MPKQYENFTVDLFDYRKRGGRESCRVTSISKAGEIRRSDAPMVEFPEDLRDRISKLDRRELLFDEMCALGIDIGNLLFPDVIRSLFTSSLSRAGGDLPLRICIKCDGF